jgi:hypothetical protein
MWLAQLKHHKEKYENTNWTKFTVKCVRIHLGHNEQVNTENMY